VRRICQQAILEFASNERTASGRDSGSVLRKSNASGPAGIWSPRPSCSGTLSISNARSPPFGGTGRSTMPSSRTSPAGLESHQTHRRLPVAGDKRVAQGQFRPLRRRFPQRDRLSVQKSPFLGVTPRYAAGLLRPPGVDVASHAWRRVAVHFAPNRCHTHQALGPEDDFFELRID
jgi:hypothetical protein